MKSSRISGFYKKTLEERKTIIKNMHDFTSESLDVFEKDAALPLDIADNMIENVIGTFELPLGLGLNFLINGKEYAVPMAIEEASVVASASHIAKIVYETGGFVADSTERMMTGQIQVIGCADFNEARKALLSEKQALIDAANAAIPSMVARSGGAKDMEVRMLNEASDSKYSQMLVLHLYVDTVDAMGANLINTMMESIAPLVEDLTKGKVYLRILSNLADRALARSRCVIPPHLLETGNFSGEAVRDGIIYAYEFAASDPYRAVTHNKGIMNGIDPVVIATGNDWRAVEAAAHAYAVKDGQYGSMTTWSKDIKGNLVGEIELPMAIGIVGGATRVHPMAKLALELMDVQSANELAEIIVTVGLAQNLGALKALATEGIQKGHMTLHSRSVAVAAGATGEMVDIVAEELIKLKEIRVGKAKELVAKYKQ